MEEAVSSVFLYVYGSAIYGTNCKMGFGRNEGYVCIS